MGKNKLIVGIIVGIVIALVLVVGGIAAFNLMQPKEPTIEEANIILDETIKNTFALTSFTTNGNTDFQIKSGEIVIVKAVMRNMRVSATNVWDFIKQNSEMVVTYDLMINLSAIADLIKANVPPEALDPDMFMGMDPIAMIRAIGVANISVTMEMKSIDNDSYMKITEVTGLREVITSVAGAPMAEMVMGKIAPKIGVWFKMPVDPEMREEREYIAGKIKPLIDVVVKDLPDILFVEDVLPNTRVNDVAVYNFVAGIDLNKTRDLVISLVPVIGEMVEGDAETIAEIQRNIKENWPKVVTAVKAIEMDFRTYICQERRFVIKDAGTVNVSLYRIIAALEPMITEDMTPEELAEFNKQKGVIRDIRFVVTGTFIYSDHNTVPAITPPTEYQLINL